MALSEEERAAKLTTLAHSKSFLDVQALLEYGIHRSVAPGICINARCTSLH